MGYVGCVTAACLARVGHEVIGVDIDPVKVSILNDGKAPLYEPGLTELIAEMVAAGRLRATLDDSEAVRDSEVALVCVGTPSQANGSIQLNHVVNAFSSIGRQLRKKREFYVVALRSTVLPSAVKQHLIPALEQCSGKRLGSDLGFACNPEFLREGSALHDFQHSPWTIIGSSDECTGDIVSRLYKQLPAPLIRTDPATAVLVKYFSNAFHALKVAFANEASCICREMAVDSTKMMEIFCQDSILNISPRYLMPGFAFGGSCLPKDLKALVSEAGRQGLRLPIITSVLESNRLHLSSCIDRVIDTNKRRIGLVGLTFKAQTDDLRESPAVELAERLIGKGFDVHIYEPTIGPDTIRGANRRFIEQSIPHIWKLLVPTLNDIFERSDVIVVSQKLTLEDRRQFTKMKKNQLCVDLACTLSPNEVGGEYQTIDSSRPELLAARA